MDFVPNGTGSGGLKLELHCEFMVIVGPGVAVSTRIFVKDYF